MSSRNSGPGDGVKSRIAPYNLQVVSFNKLEVEAIGSRVHMYGSMYIMCTHTCRYHIHLLDSMYRYQSQLHAGQLNYRCGAPVLYRYRATIIDSYHWGNPHLRYRYM